MAQPNDEPIQYYEFEEYVIEPSESFTISIETIEFEEYVIISKTIA